MNIYQQEGYESRVNYLTHLAEDYGVPLSDVKELAMSLGPEEDFDALVSILSSICVEGDDCFGDD